jgi:hypothetical protein
MSVSGIMAVLLENPKDHPAKYSGTYIRGTASLIIGTVVRIKSVGGSHASYESHRAITMEAQNFSKLLYLSHPKTEGRVVTSFNTDCIPNRWNFF